MNAPVAAKGWQAPTIVFAASLVLYLFTGARAPQWGDGLEFVAAAAVDGVPHPTGYPLLMLLLGPLSHGPNAYVKCVVLCALFAAVAAALVTLLAGRLVNEFNESSDASRTTQLPLFAGLVMACSASLWGSATIVEVYGLNALFLASLLLILVPGMDRPLCWHRLALAGLLQGLALANHLSSGCMVVLLLFRMLQSAGQSRSGRVAVIVTPILAGCLGLALYATLPARAAAHPPINWGNPQGIDGIRWHLSGGIYKGLYFMQSQPGTPFTAATYLRFLGVRAVQLFCSAGGEMLGGAPGLPAWSQAVNRGIADVAFPIPIVRAAILGVFGAGLLLLAIWGGVSLSRQRGRKALILLAAPTLQLLLILAYNILDVVDYFLGLWITLLPFLICGVCSLVERWHRQSANSGRDFSPQKIMILFGAFVLIAVLSNWKVAARNRRSESADWIAAFRTKVPQKAMVLCHGDHDLYMAWYVQHAMGLRPDLLIVGTSFLRQEWYAEMLPQADILGRKVTLEPAEPFGFDQYDQADLIARTVIDPNLKKGPIVTTDADMLVLSILARRYTMTSSWELLTEGQQLNILERQGLQAPAVIYEIKNK